MTTPTQNPDSAGQRASNRWITSPDPDLAGIAVDSSSPVLITGATGYVAGWIVKGLLDAGCTVHAAVRNPDDVAKVGHLLAVAENAPGRLRLFASDLLAEGSYAQAMEGCAVVIHTASPFVRNVDDPQRDLVDPAVAGTRNVLATVEATPSVKRVVLTSSVAAMYTDVAECETKPGGILTEDQWNTTASLTYEPYYYSKTLAEKAAWNVAQVQSRWSLVTINPSLVIGPTLNAQPTSDSFSVMRQLLSRSMALGVPRLGMGAVDVRDVARAHIAAAFTPAASGRYIVNGHDTDAQKMLIELKPRFGRRFGFSTRTLPTWLVMLVGPAVGMSRKFVAGNVDHVFHADASRSRVELGMNYRPLRESLEDMAEQIAAH